jgi:hypothetical protein
MQFYFCDSCFGKVFEDQAAHISRQLCQTLFQTFATKTLRGRGFSRDDNVVDAQIKPPLPHRFAANIFRYPIAIRDWIFDLLS